VGKARCVSEKVDPSKWKKAEFKRK
jgi:hypothetical protein